MLASEALGPRCVRILICRRASASSPAYGIGMNPDSLDDLAPRSCRQKDLAGLIGVLALLEGEIWAGAVSPRLRDRIGHRLAREALVGSSPTERELRQAISDLNHRLRYALGEYDEPPPPLSVPE
jgi:hypothetical protein